MAAATPRVGKLTGTVTWPDGTPFQGWVEVVLVVPGQSGASPLWPRLTVGPGYPTIQVPIWTRIPIVDGIFDQASGLWYNADLTPPNSQYAAYYYDSTGATVGLVTSLFTISAALTTPPISVTVVPTAQSVIPTPRDVI